MSNKIIFILLALLSISFFLQVRMKEEEKIIDKIIIFEKERMKERLNLKMSEVNRLSKMRSEYNEKVREILEEIKLAGNGSDRLYKFMEEKSKEDEFYEKLTIKKKNWYPEELKQLKFVEEIFDQLYKRFNVSEELFLLKNAKEIIPVVRNIENQRNGLITLTLQPFGVYDLGKDTDYQFFIKNEPVEVNKLPFYYSGNVKDVKCVFTSPVTGQTFSYESN